MLDDAAGPSRQQSLELPPDLDAFLREPRPAVIATIRADGRPSTAAVWFLWEAGHVMLSMSPDGARARNLRRNPGLAITVLGQQRPPAHVSLIGRAVEFRDDSSLQFADRLSIRFTGKPFEHRSLRPCLVVARIDRWHTARFA